MCKKLHTSKEGRLTDASQAHLDEQMSFYRLPHYTKALKTAVKLLQKMVFIVLYKNSGMSVKEKFQQEPRNSSDLGNHSV